MLIYLTNINGHCQNMINQSICLKLQNIKINFEKIILDFFDMPNRRNRT